MDIALTTLPVAAPSCGVDGHCVTCGDDAVEVLVLSVDQGTQLALVALGEATEEIDISLVDDVAVGDRLLAHGGVALGRA